jgi:mono/diheme cytochrome c family protein
MHSCEHNSIRGKPGIRRSTLVLATVAACLLCGCQQKMASQPSFKPLTRNDFFADGRSARPLPEHTIARGYLRTDSALFTGRKKLAADEADAAQQDTAGSERSADDNDANNDDTDANETDRQTDNNETNSDEANNRQPSADGQDVGQGKRGFEDNDDFVDEFPIPIDQATIEHGYHRFMIYCVVCHDPLGRGRGKIVERGYTPPPSYHIDRLREAPVGRLFAVVSEGYGSMPSYGEQIPPRDRWAIVAYVRALQLSQHFPEDRLTDQMRAEFEAQTAQGEQQASGREHAAGEPATPQSKEGGQP